MLRQLSRSSDTRREYPAGPSVHFTASSCFRLLLHRIAALFDIRSFHKNAPKPGCAPKYNIVGAFSLASRRSVLPIPCLRYSGRTRSSVIVPKKQPSEMNAQASCKLFLIIGSYIDCFGQRGPGFIFIIISRPYPIGKLNKGRSVQFFVIHCVFHHLPRFFHTLTVVCSFMEKLRARLSAAPGAFFCLRAVVTRTAGNGPSGRLPRRRRLPSAPQNQRCRPRSILQSSAFPPARSRGW